MRPPRHPRRGLAVSLAVLVLLVGLGVSLWLLIGLYAIYHIGRMAGAQGRTAQVG